jgi:hypothetical protein
MRLIPAAGLAAACTVLASAGSPGETIEEKTQGMEARPGLFPLYWDGQAGRLWLEVGSVGEELLYVVSLPAGVGSNDVGLDRNQLGSTRVVRFERVGPKLLLVEPNYAFRAGTDNAAERRAVEEAFARSVLFGFEIAAESEGRVLVDATSFALRDAHGVVEALSSAGQGSYRLEESRSAVHLESTKAFPRNTEIEVTLTFVGEEPGEWVRDVVPTPGAITVRERHSLVRLPEPGFEPREADPRSGYIALGYADYAAPLGAPMRRNLILRHRLAKRDPAAAVSAPVAPIVYYLDPGTPEPVRSALLDGARWWDAAFEAAGYRGAFRVEMLPEDADPLDVRYNVINWVHRATRGWSYGSSVHDPRTGEIIKGHVLLGSLRVRQDYLLAEGLLAPYERGDERSEAAEAMALARLRQLSAHEVGHTLGLVHNYIASAQGRASVMDYPHPIVGLGPDGVPDLSDAYAVGVGAWDEVAIAYGYQDFPVGTDVRAALEGLLDDARARGVTFLTDEDARPLGSAHPQVHLWDNGEDAAAELTGMMRVRRAALDRFGERVLRSGSPLATLEEVLVPLYLRHRYQLEAAAKLVAGQSYGYADRGDGQDPPRPVPAADQERALAALLATLAPRELAIPAGVLEQLPPRPPYHPAHRELFPRTTGLVFDAITPATVAAGLTLQAVLHPERASRLVQQHALDPGLPSLESVIATVLEAVFAPPEPDPYLAELRRAVQSATVDRLVELAAGEGMPPVRARTEAALLALAERLAGGGPHEAMLARHVRAFLERPYAPRQPPPRLTPPPGSPIGSTWLQDACEYR